MQHKVRRALALLMLLACTDDSLAIVAPNESLTCDPDNGGLTLPVGFCAIVVADLMMDGQPAAARHMVVTPSGDLFVAINSANNRNPSFGVFGLRDVDGDGKADQQTQFSANLGGNGLEWGFGRLYLAANNQVVRFVLPDGQLSPGAAGDVVVSGLSFAGDHISKSVILGNSKTLYVNIGSATNSCQVNNRLPQSPGISPCPELENRAGIWAFDPTINGQTLTHGRRYGTGYRNTVAIDINPANNTLYGVQHGRDMLAEDWPQFFTIEQAAVMPAEEFVKITEGSDNGWPYCYFDAVSQNKKVLAPEYGGDGVKTSGGTSPVDCAAVSQPLATFGAHWAPNGLHFYLGSQFPAHYRRGAFVAFHGGVDRSPLPNEGYKVMFMPMKPDGTPAGPAEPFADGFAASNGLLPATAKHRPVGVAEGPDGSIYISDDKGGRIWRIIYRG